MVVPAHRPGGQAQFIELPVPAGDDEGLAPVLEWARAHLDRPLTVADLARRAAMSPRTFHRRLQAVTGTTPLQRLLDQRLGLTRSLLESTNLPIEKVGELSGLGTADNLRHHFLKHLGVSPGDYRRAFPGGAGGRAWTYEGLSHVCGLHPGGRRIPSSCRTSSSTTSSSVASTQPALQSCSRPLTLPMNPVAARR